MAGTEVDYDPFQKPAGSEVGYDPFDATSPRANAAFVKRVETGQKISTFLSNIGPTLKGMGEGMQEGMGDTMPGMSDESIKKFQEWGIFADPEKGKPGMNGIMAGSEQLLRSAVSFGDAVMRLPNVIIKGAAGALRASLQESGTTSETNANSAARELENFANWKMADTGSHIKMEVPPGSRVPVKTELGTAPSHMDFRNANVAITEGNPHRVVDEKLQRIYDDTGVTPQEVYKDSLYNPEVQQALVSRNPDAMPSLYGYGHERVEGAWDNFLNSPKDDPSLFRRTADGVNIPTEAGIGDYLQDFARQAGFTIKSTPAIEGAWDRTGPQYRSGGPNRLREVRIPTNPEYQYRNWYGMSRVEVMFHEIGHALDHLELNQTLEKNGWDSTAWTKWPDELRAEMTKASQGFAAKLWEENPEYRMTPRETLADTIAAWLSNPAARKNMPLFTEKFGPQLNKYLDIVNKTLPTRGEGGSWTPPPDGQNIVGGGGGKPPMPPRDFDFSGPPEPLRIEGPDPDYNAARKSIADRISVGENTGQRPRTFARWYTDFLDKHFPILQAEGGGTLNAINSPYKLARLFSGWAGKATAMIEDGMYDFNTYKKVGPGLREILAPVKDNIQEFREFAASARAMELEKRGIEHGFDIKDVRTHIERNMDGPFPKVLENLIAYQNNLTAYLRDSGVLSAKAYAGMMEANRLFVPFHRVMNTIVEARGSGAGTLQARNPVKYIEGSRSKIIDPIESIVKNTYLLTQMAEKNFVGVKLVDMLVEGRAEAARAGRKVPEGENLPAVRYEDAERKRVETDLKNNGLEKPAPELVDVLDNAARPDIDGEISVYRNGQRETYRVDPELARSFKGMDAASINIFHQVLAPFTRTLRAGAVLNPAFQARHTFRDFIYAFVTTTGKTVFTPWDMVKGGFGLWKKDLDYWNWQKGGGGNISIVSLDRNYMHENVQDLTQQTGLFTRSWNVVLDPANDLLTKGKALAWAPVAAAKDLGRIAIHPMQVATELATNMSHLGAYKKKMRELDTKRAVANKAGQELATIQPSETGDLALRPDVDLRDAIRDHQNSIQPDGSLKKDILEASWVSRDTAVDASRIGAQMRGFNMISAFANIKLQDTDRVVRSIISNPVSTALKIGIGITTPSILLWSVNHQDSRYVKEVPHWEKDVFWHIMTDKWENATPEQALPREPDQVRISSGQLQVNNGTIFRLPKPFAAGVIFGSGPERLLDAYYAHNPHAFKGYFNSIKEVTAGDIVPNAVVPMIEQTQNKSLFTGRTIIPHPLEKGLPEYQYSAYTSETAKELGKVIGAFPGIRDAKMEDGFFGGAARALSSPVLIENYINAWSGSLGNFALAAVDKGLREAGLVPQPSYPTNTLADMSFIKAFVSRHPSAGVDSISSFYEDMKKVEAYNTTWKARIKEGDLSGTQNVSEQGAGYMFAKLDSLAKVMGQHNKIIHELYKNPEVQPYEKRQQIDMLYYAMIRMAERGNDMMDEFKKATKAKD